MLNKTIILILIHNFTPPPPRKIWHLMERDQRHLFDFIFRVFAQFWNNNSTIRHHHHRRHHHRHHHHRHHHHRHHHHHHHRRHLVPLLLPFLQLILPF
jgi:hypothetical protein